MKHLVVFLFLLGLAFHQISGQYPNVPIVSTPKPATMQSNAVIQGTTVPQPNAYQPFGSSADAQNVRVISEIGKIRKQQLLVQQAHSRPVFNFEVCRSVIPLPDFGSESGAEYYRNAFGEISKMLTGEAPLSLKDAIFLSENAYLENKMSYKAYNNHISETVGLCREKIRQQSLNPDDDEVKMMMLFHYITDTFKLKLPGAEQMLVHYPIQYDFEDFYGRTDLCKRFITKVMDENSGQCHNMPEYCLILADAMGVNNAYLSRSPDHSFVKFQDNDSRWHNLELTCGAVINDQNYLNSGFIKAEALRNKLYLEPLTRQETVADVLVDLASGYVRKYGYDEFVLQCAETALKYYPACVRARMLRANSHTARALYVIERTGMPNPERLHLCPQAYKLHQIMLQSYQELDDTGYEEMPPEVYLDWLNRVNEEVKKPENQKKSIRLQQIIK